MDIVLTIISFLLLIRIIILLFFQKIRILKYLNEESIVLQPGEYDFVLFGVVKLSRLNYQNYRLINLETGGVISSRPLSPQISGLYGFQKYLRIIRFSIEDTGSYRIGVNGLESLTTLDSQLHLLNIFTSQKRTVQFTGIAKPFPYMSLIIHIMLLVITTFIIITVL